MKIKIKNLGVLRQAEFELGDMTIICGQNNTGKTYATYALYGFLVFWHEVFIVPVAKSAISDLLKKGTIELDSREFIARAEHIILEACKEYAAHLPGVFASSEKNFEKTEFSVHIGGDEITPLDSFERTFGAGKSHIFTISKSPGETRITISLLNEESGISEKPVLEAIGRALKEIVFTTVFPSPFIASAERTGASIFRKELDLTRNRLLELMSAEGKNGSLAPLTLLDKAYSMYAMPVKRTIDFHRQLEDIAKIDSFITKKHSKLLDEFADIVGGEYRVIQDVLYYIPNSNKRMKLTMGESSSSVRSLLDIGFYIRHVAQPGDLLMVDEPELNLHPENQRKIARLLSQLVNLGIKIFITTHSDYIIKELNTLIMLQNGNPIVERIRKDEGYRKEELLSADRLRVYSAEDILICLDGSKNGPAAILSSRQISTRNWE